MADLEPRVKQVEEDVAILKGEIKSVLMEVRSSLLSQNNPFSGASFGSSGPSFSANISTSAPAMNGAPAFNGGGPSFGGGGPSVGNAPSFGGGAPSFGGNAPSFDNNGPSFGSQSQPSQPQPAPEVPFAQEEPKPHDQPLQTANQIDIAQHAAPAQPLHAPQPVPLPVAPRRSWELNTLAMLLAWCQGNMVRLSAKEMTSLLSLARYGGLVDEELAAILLEISVSFDAGKEGRAATVSEYLLALHELHTVIKEEEEPSVPRLRRVS